VDSIEAEGARAAGIHVGELARRFERHRNSYPKTA